MCSSDLSQGSAPVSPSVAFPSFPEGPDCLETRPLNTAAKILTHDSLAEWRQAARRAGKVLVVTNGCFDILHAGHVDYLESARSLGDLLIVGLNGDQSVQELKGPGRPINAQGDRARVLAALGCVDAVCIFPEKRATRFLEAVQPDVYVKGGDYTLETIDQQERRAVESAGGRIAFIPFTAGKSTSALVAVIRKL